MESFTDRSLAQIQGTQVGGNDDQRGNTLVVDDPIADRNEDIDTGPTVPSTAAGQGSVVALASARGNPANAAQAQALNILVNPTGSATSLPRAALVQPSIGEEATTVALGAMDFSLAALGCNPCLFSTGGVQGTTPQLAQHMLTTVGGVDVYMGRWTGVGSGSLFNGGVSLNALNDHHYAVALASNRTGLNSSNQMVVPSSFSLNAPNGSSLAVYSLLAATSPTDAQGATGVLQRADLELDFMQQIVSMIELDISFADQRAIFAKLTSPVSLPTGALAGLFAPLTATCTGGACSSGTSLSGSTSFSFIGTGGAHALGVYSLDSSAQTQNVFGSYLLAQTSYRSPSLVVFPPSVNSPGAAAFAAHAVNAVVSGNVAGSGTGIGISTVAGVSGVVSGFSGSGTNMQIQRATLAESGATTIGSDLISFGRWSGSYSLSAGGSALTSDQLHYAYSAGALGTLPTVTNPLLVHYALAGGTSPTDKSGNTGELYSLDMIIDFYLQQVESFNLALGFPDRNYTAGLVNQLAQSISSPSFGLTLAGTCTGSSCATSSLTGSARLNLTGASGFELAGAFGSYALQGVGAATEQVAGAFALSVEGTSNPLDVNMANETPVGAPANSVAGLVTILDGGAGYAPYTAVVGEGSGDIQLLDVYDSQNSLVGLGFASDASCGADCTFSLAHGTLVQRGSYLLDGADIYFGRWQASSATFDIDGYTSSSGDYLYIYSDALYGIPQVSLPSVGQYSLRTGTAPIDQDGNAGTLDGLDIELDFFFQRVDRFDLQATFEDRVFTATLNGDPVALNVGVTGINLRGECNGGSCGSDLQMSGLGTLLIGDATANTLFGTYGLQATSGLPGVMTQGSPFGGSHAFGGVYVAGRDSLDPHPFYVANPSPVLVTGDGVVAIGATAYTGSVAYLPLNALVGTNDGEIGLISVNGVNNVFASLGVDDDDCNGCSVTVLDGVLVDHLGANNIGGATGLSANLGRWHANLDVNVDGLVDVLQSLHYAYSGSPTDIAGLLQPGLFDAFNPKLSYSLKAATNPTDSNGDTGWLYSASLDISLLQQLITHFELGVAIGERDMVASILNPVNLADGLGDGLELLGSCVGSDCGTTNVAGSTSLGLIGPTGEGAIGSYSLFEYSGVVPDDISEAESSYLVSGAFVLARDSVTDLGPLTVDFTSDDAPEIQSVEGLAAFAGSLYPNLDCCGNDQYVVGWQLIADSAGDGSIGAVSLAGVNNALVALSDSSNIPADTTTVRAWSLAFGDLVEAGYTSIGAHSVNWGRWQGASVLGEGQTYPEQIEPEIFHSDRDAHFIYTTASRSPLPSFGQPTLITYAYSGGTAPTDHLGNSGDILGMSMTLDLHHQTVRDFFFQAEVGDSYFHGHLFPPANGIGGYSLARLLEDDYLPLAGLCNGGYCDNNDYYGGGFSVYEGGSPRNQLAGYAFLAPFGNDAEGFIGSFELVSADPFWLHSNSYGNGSSHHPYTHPSYYLNYDDIALTGAFVLAQTQVRDHPFWLQNPSYQVAQSPAGAIVTGTLREWIEGTNFYTPISGWGVPGPEVLGTTDLGMASNLVVYVAGGESDCEDTVCGLQVQDAVLSGYIPSHLTTNTWQYLSNPATISWGTWSHRPVEGNSWFFGPNGEGITANSTTSFIYASELTQSIENLAPLTSSSDSAWYYYAGGPRAVNELGEAGWVHSMQAGINFHTQMLTDFYADVRFNDGREMYSYLPYADAVVLGVEMQMDLQGYCYGCGYSDGDLSGSAHMLLVGQQAEQIIGGLAMSTNDAGNGAGIYTLELAFLLNQYIDLDWVVPQPERAPSSSVAVIVPMLNMGDGTYAARNLHVLDDGGSSTIELTSHLVPADSYGGIGVTSAANLIGPTTRLDNLVTRVFDAQTGDLIQLGQRGASLQSDGIFLGGAPIDTRYTYYEPGYSGYSYDYADCESYFDCNGTQPAFTLTYGRWHDGQYSGLFNDGAGGTLNFETLSEHLPFIYSEDLTQQLPSQGFSPFGTVANYSFYSAPYSYDFGNNAVDSYGDTHSVTSVQIAFDLGSQELLDFYLSLDYGAAYFYGVQDESSSVATSLIGGTAGAPMLEFAVSGYDYYSNLYGSATLSFVGANAEGVIGGFGVAAADGTRAYVGTYFAEQEYSDHLVINPAASALATGSAVAYAGEGFGGNAGFVVDNLNNFAGVTTVNSLNHDHPGSLANIVVNDHPTCGDCSWELTYGELSSWGASEDSYGTSDTYEAYWGRWSSRDSFVQNGEDLDLAEFSHFVWSPNMTPMSALNDFSEAEWGPGLEGLYDYHLAAATNPTDNLGNDYGWVDNIYMQLDVYSQQITQFDLSVYFNGTDWDLESIGPTSLDANAPFANIALTGQANSYYDSETVAATGNTSLFLIGSQAQGAIGSYSLEAADFDTSVHGAYLLDRNYDGCYNCD